MIDDIYAKYSLNYDEFKASSLSIRISSSPLATEFTQWLQPFTKRKFLKSPLTQEQYDHIMPTETLLSAGNAEVFQSLVANVAIKESFEPLINLETLTSRYDQNWSYSDTPYHPACGDWAGKKRLFWVRQSLGSALIELSGVLEQFNLGIRFEDAFRPTGVQEGLFKRRYQMAKQENPTFSHDELVLEARSKTAYTPRFAAHKAGAAVDVRLFDLGDKSLLDIGHGYPDGGEIVRLETPFVTQSVWENRKILEFAAHKAGLSMYPFEDWHLCLGDATASVVSGMRGEAKYGPIKELSKDGTIVKTYSQDELDEVFILDAQTQN